MGTTINSHRRLGYPNHQQQSRRTPVKMRTYDDTFSGEKIYPGKGKLYVRGDSKIFRFQNGKTESLFLQRKNPRRIAWTVLFRRQHKKGISEEVAEKRAAALSAKKAEKAKNAAGAAKGNARVTSKMGAKGAPKKIQASTR